MEQNGNESPFFDEGDDEPAAPPGRALVPASRHDGFTPQRRRLFLETLRETGCVQDACRVAGISDTAVYKARKRDPELGELWQAALSRAGTDVDTLAWHRAVVGVEEPVWAYGKLVGTRRKRDDRLFRMLVQASDPNRYGGPGYFTRRAIEQRIRAEIEEEQRQMLEPDEADALHDRLADKLRRLAERELREGKVWRDEHGKLIPVGYVRAADAAPVASEAEAPAPAETGAGASPGEPDRTDSEPVRGGEGEVEESRVSADFRPPGPRITRL